MSRPLLLSTMALATACAGRPPAPDHPTATAAAAAPALCEAQIARVWHGRTPNAKAEEYAAYLAGAITKFPTIPGNLGYQMMRETIGDETHFSVISYWKSRDSIHAYAGADISMTHNLPRDPEFLIDLEPHVKNYDLVVKAVGCPQ